MLGLMQQQPLLVSSIIRHAARHHSKGEVVSQMSETVRHRTTYAELEHRARRLARVLLRLGVQPGDRIGTLAWNTYRHVELFYAISGMGAVCHTVNPRLAQQDIAYIITHAGDSLLFVDASFVGLIEAIAPAIAGCVRGIVVMVPAEDMPDVKLPSGMALYCYEALMDAADEDFVWPEFDENTAQSLCYTSGTTGRPKGVLYSHRSTVLHTYAANMADAFGLRAVDRMLPGAPMFHAAAWSLPYTVPMVGAALVLPGRYLDPASLVRLLNEERATYTGAVPTVWLAVLNYLRETGQKLPHLRRIFSGGSAVPRAMIEGFAEYGVEVQHAWGMTETSPLVSVFAPKPQTDALTGEDAMRVKLKQGRAVFGTEIKIVDAEGNDLPWDGTAFGDLLVRGPWVCREYLGRGGEGAADEEGWFRTGDVATIDPEGYIELVDRSKDVIKSGGEWISSIALENIAVSHPDVAEAAVINARHPRWMERPLLLVVPKNGRSIDKESLLGLYRRAGRQMVAARCRGGSCRASAYGHRQAEQTGAAGTLAGLPGAERGLATTPFGRRSRISEPKRYGRTPMLDARSLSALLAEFRTRQFPSICRSTGTARDVRAPAARLRDLINEAETALAERGFDDRERARLLGPAREFAESADFAEHRDPGLALFLADGGAITRLALPETPPESRWLGGHFLFGHYCPWSSVTGGSTCWPLIPIVPSCSRQRRRPGTNCRLMTFCRPALMRRPVPCRLAIPSSKTRVWRCWRVICTRSPRRCNAVRQTIRHRLCWRRNRGSRRNSPKPRDYHSCSTDPSQSIRSHSPSASCISRHWHVSRRCWMPSAIVPWTASAPGWARASQPRRTGSRKFSAAARDGRIGAMVLAEDASLWGSFDIPSGVVVLRDGPEADAEELINLAAVLTLRQGGRLSHCAAG